MKGYKGIIGIKTTDYFKTIAEVICASRSGENAIEICDPKSIKPYLKK